MQAKTLICKELRFMTTPAPVSNSASNRTQTRGTRTFPLKDPPKVHSVETRFGNAMLCQISGCLVDKIAF